MAHISSKAYPLGIPPEVFTRLTHDLGDRQAGMAIWRIREYLQISREEAASHAGISPAYVWRIEHGERYPRQWTWIRLCFVSLSLSPAQTVFILRLAGCSPA